MTESNDRIIDGICFGLFNEVEEKVDSHRIKTGYKEGKSGDDGYSALLSGHSISKASPTCAIYSAQEHLQQAIAVCVASEQVRNKEFIVVLLWLQEALTSLGSFAYSKGKATQHMFPQEFLVYMEKRIAIVKELLGPAKDFIIYEDPALLLINDLRVKSRDIERAFVGFWQSPEITRYLMRHPYLIERMQNQATILNRCSSWLWAECRYEGHLAKVNEKYWPAIMPSFPKL